MYWCKYLTVLNYATITNQLFRLLKLDLIRLKIYINSLLAGKEILTFAEEGDLISENDIVTKRGKTTGTTYGYIINDSLAIEMDGYIYKNCYGIENINNDDPFFRPGDSGSGVYVIRGNNPIFPLGIAFALLRSQTAVCDISQIVDQLGLQIVRFAKNKMSQHFKGHWNKWTDRRILAYVLYIPQNAFTYRFHSGLFNITWKRFERDKMISV